MVPSFSNLVPFEINAKFPTILSNKSFISTYLNDLLIYRNFYFQKYHIAMNINVWISDMLILKIRLDFKSNKSLYDADKHRLVNVMYEKVALNL